MLWADFKTSLVEIVNRPTQLKHLNHNSNFVIHTEVQVLIQNDDLGRTTIRR